MYRFIVTFQVIINGGDSHMGTVGSVSSINDYRPNQVKNTILNHYRKSYPKEKLAVIIRDVKPASKEEYELAARKFISLRESND